MYSRLFCVYKFDQFGPPVILTFDLVNLKLDPFPCPPVQITCVNWHQNRFILFF